MKKHIPSNNIAGKNVAAIRKHRNITQAQLGKSVGRDRFFVSRLEQGGLFDASYLEPIAIALSVDDPLILTRELIDTNSISSVASVKKRKSKSRR